MSLRTATASIDRKALVNNFDFIKSLAPTAKILAVLKANAYGHGLERIAKALPKADAFGVARLDEALALRAKGVVKPIVLLEGFFDANDLPVLAVNNLQTVVHNHQQLNTIINAELDEPLKVWLKVDTGMHRLGVDPGDFETYLTALSASNNVQNDIVLMSHLGCADDKASELTSHQIALFDQLTGQHLLEKSLANSAGVLSWPKSHYEWIRPGLMLYGVSPMASDKEPSIANIGIQPVMTLQSSIIAIRKIKAGETLGYGAAWQSPEDTVIGVVAIGYGDGYPRHAQNGTPVFINGREVPLVGRVSMDMITVDLGANATDEIGDIATLWGKDLPVETIAQCASTIPYELLCNITRRVQIEVI